MRTWRGARRVTVRGESSGCCRLRHSPRSISLILRGIGDHRAVIFEHDVGFQAEAVGAGDQARVDDVEPHLIEHGGGAGEAVHADAACT